MRYLVCEYCCRSHDLQFTVAVHHVPRLLHCTLAAVQCIVIGPVCVWWVCYHDNSKLSASILTKLGLEVKVVTISS